ncbi:MAG TPA: uroporphyrinogen decarboxylase family protein [Candidatus Brocadiia bacterium]|nr:uroporphyrinogen decarboxylase family protein [Candidatus Brocadiia bacterium]
MTEDKQRRTNIVKGALEHRPGHIPFHVDALPTAAARILDAFSGSDLDRALRNSLSWVSLPKRRTEAGAGLTADEFGVVWTVDPSNRGHVYRHPWPDGIPSEINLPPLPTDLEVSALAEKAASRPGYVVAWVGDLFERAHFLRGLEGILTDFHLDPDGMERLLDALTERISRTMRLMSGIQCDAFFLSDDYGAQASLMMRPETWRRFIAPRVERLAAVSHELGRAFFLHSCGCVREIAADLPGIGVDALHPVQPECQNVKTIMEMTKGKLTLYGGVGTQDVMRSAEASEVRSEVRRVATELGQEGGFILAPSISLMEDVPLENIKAFLAEAWQLAGES